MESGFWALDESNFFAASMREKMALAPNKNQILFAHDAVVEARASFLCKEFGSAGMDASGDLAEYKHPSASLFLEIA